MVPAYSSVARTRLWNDRRLNCHSTFRQFCFHLSPRYFPRSIIASRPRQNSPSRWSSTESRRSRTKMRTSTVQASAIFRRPIVCSAKVQILCRTNYRGARRAVAVLRRSIYALANAAREGAAFARVVIERAVNVAFRYAADVVLECAANEHLADAACSIARVVSVFALAQRFVVRPVAPPVLARSAQPVLRPFAV